MEYSGIFPAVQDAAGNWDRTYKTDFIRGIIHSLFTDGIFKDQETCCQVAAAGNDMRVFANAGNALILGAKYVNDSNKFFVLDSADGIANRIDRIVLRYSTANRMITAELKKGIFATNPVPSDLQRDSDVWELALADIYVAAGATSISQANITDRRFDASLCGVVNAISIVDVSKIFAQYDDAFVKWFENLHVQLDSNAAGNLQNQIDKLNSLAEHPYIHVKTGTNHNLSGEGSNIDFLANADYLYGDTFTVNGVSVTACLQNGEPLPYKYFTSGNIVSGVRLNGSKLNFKAAGGGGMLDYNLYAQPAEPAKKEGIWIKSDHGYTGITVDTQMYLANSWMPDGSFAAPPSGFQPLNKCATVGRKVYGGSFHSYNLDTNTWESLASHASTYHSLLQYGDYLYDVGGDYDTTNHVAYFYAYRFSLISKTWETLATYITSDTALAGCLLHAAVLIDGKVYGLPKGIYFDINTLTWGQDTSVTEKFVGSDGNTLYGNNLITSIGTKIYWYYSGYYYCYDVVSKTETKSPFSPFYSYTSGSAIAIGTKIYMFGVSLDSGSAYGKKVYVYDTLTQTFSALTEMFTACQNPALFFIDSVIHVCDNELNGVAGSPWHRGYSFTSKQYSEDTFVLLRTSNSAGNYLTELATAKGITGSYTRFPSWFNDAILFYGGTLHGDLPTYYGDSAQWVKFKN